MFVSIALTIVVVLTYRLRAWTWRDTAALCAKQDVIQTVLQLGEVIDVNVIHAEWVGHNLLHHGHFYATNPDANTDSDLWGRHTVQLVQDIGQSPTIGLRCVTIRDQDDDVGNIEPEKNTKRDEVMAMETLALCGGNLTVTSWFPHKWRELWCFVLGQ